MDMTTVTRVKDWLPGYNGSRDTLLQRIVTGVSDMVTARLERHSEAVARTEYFDHEGDGRIFLRGTPISTSPAPQVWFDNYATFGVSVAVVDSSLYTVDYEKGILVWSRTSPYLGPRSIKVTYTGGMAANTAAFITAYPQLAFAVEAQCRLMFQRADQMGATALSEAGGSVSFLGSVKFLDDLEEQIAMHRRVLL